MFRLAETLGCPVFWLESMPAQEFAEWQAYFALERQVREMVADKVDPEAAAEHVWTDRESPESDD